MNDICCNPTEDRRKLSRKRSSPCADFAPQIPGQKEEAVMVWRLPTHISQSRLGDRSSASNACTIIALKMAEALHAERLCFKAAGSSPRCFTWRKSPSTGGRQFYPERARMDFAYMDEYQIGQNEQVAAGGEDLSEEERDYLLRQSSDSSSDDGENIRMTRSRKLMMKEEEEAKSGLVVDPNVVNALANSIIDGNQIHEDAVRLNRRELHELNFTIPDAILACSHVFKEMDYKTVRGPMHGALIDHISCAIRFWDGSLGCQRFNQSHLFLLLIAHERTVLVLYQPMNRTVALVDSHSHGRQQGALLAAADIGDLPMFCTWIVHHIFPESIHRVEEDQEFEISVIRYISLVFSVVSRGAVRFPVKLCRIWWSLL